MRKYIIIHILLLTILLALYLSNNNALANVVDNFPSSTSSTNLINIRNVNGKFYAYIALLFNGNPHFVNLIQEDSISPKAMNSKKIYIKAYRNYLKTINNYSIKRKAAKIFDIFMRPDKYSKSYLSSFEKKLEENDIVIRFAKSPQKVTLDYCIYGKRKQISIKHPLLNIQEKIFNIHPFIYYDEFSTSNSTFYFDMIYINPDEVTNDYIISKKVLANMNVDSMFFVGARVTEDIKYCLKKSFSNKKSIKKEIQRMFEIHELTHKIVDNHYNCYDQIIGEELSLSSTIYANPYLGLAVLYSYLDYNAMNPHRMGAVNIIRFFATELNNQGIIDNPSQIRNLTSAKLKSITKKHFFSVIQNIKTKKKQ